MEPLNVAQLATQLAKHPDYEAAWQALASFIPNGEFRSIGMGLDGILPTIFIRVGDATGINVPPTMKIDGHVVFIKVEGDAPEAYFS